MKKVRVGVLISGRGSNLKALIAACKKKAFPAEIALVVSNRPRAKGLDYAKKAGIAYAVVNHKRYPDRDAFETALHEKLRGAGAELICLAGFMRVLNPGFVNRWRDRILNIHPSLLPAFRGLHTHERVINAGVRVTGCTVHFVRPAMDDGPIIIQAAVPVAPGDTPETLAKKVLAFEHKIYPEALRLVASGEARVAGDKVQIKSRRSLKAGLINPPLAGK